MKLKNKSGENNVPLWQNASFTCDCCLNEYTLERDDIVSCRVSYKRNLHRRTDLGLIKYIWNFFFGKTRRKTEQKILQIKVMCSNCLADYHGEIPLGEEEFIGYV